MRLYSFNVKNFKSIIDTGECKISDIDNIVVLAGQNESGKSSVLEALDFFANGPSKKFEKFEKRQGTNSTEVQCTFLIGKYDKEYLTEDYGDYGEVKKFIENIKEVSLLRKFENGKDNGISIIESFFDGFPDIAKNTKMVVMEPVSKDDKPEGEPVQETTPTPDKAVKSKEEIMKELAGKIIEAIPTFSLYNSFTDLLPSEIAVAELQNSNAVQDFEKVFNVKLKELADITDSRERKIKIKDITNRATDDFNQFWSQKISNVTGGTDKYRFSIEVNDAEPKKIIFMIEGEDQTPLYLEQKSMGFRWFSSFHLRLRALMEESDEYEYGDNDNNVIILIDEPGQNLHDTAQKDVKKILDETASKHIQIIYSTHNPNLIGNVNTNEIEYTRIRIVTNHPEKGTKVYNVSQFISRKDGGSLDALSPIRTAMGLNSAGSIFDKSKFNVVVEGITDNYYLTALREILKKDERIHFIPVCGVDNVKSMVGLLIGWGMDYKAVFDDDPRQGRKAYNDLKKFYFEGNDDFAHEHIFKIKDCNGIEDIFSKDYFRKIIFDKELNNDEKKLANSELVKISGKELVARNFLEKVRNCSSDIKLDDASKKKSEEIFTWLNEKFSIQTK
ncbi:MAG: AAA family ATPase [Candidatus Moranbacteria bacterium]|nr:AAA family ATPase [Candidatus Moranbacteria bacterium]